MSRFFDSHSDSEFDSDSQDQDADLLVTTQRSSAQTRMAAINLAAFSDDDDDGEGAGRRLLRSTKDKRYIELETHTRSIKNCMKNRDIVLMLSHFENVVKLYTRSQNVFSKQEGGNAPDFYLECLHDTERFVNQLWEDRTARKHLSKLQSKALSSLRQRLRKYTKEAYICSQLERYLASRDITQPETQSHEGEAETVSQLAPSGDDTAIGAETHNKVRFSDDVIDDSGHIQQLDVTGERSDVEEGMEGQAEEYQEDQEDSDSDISWDMSGTDLSEEDDQANYSSLREYFLKKTVVPGEKEDESKRKQRKEVKERSRQVVKDKRRQADSGSDVSADSSVDEEADDSEQEAVGGARGRKQKVRLFPKDTEITYSVVHKKFTELFTTRGRRSTNKRDLIELLHELLNIVETHQLALGLLFKLKFSLISCIFDYLSSLRPTSSLRPHLWQKVNERCDSVLAELLVRPDIFVSTCLREEHERLETPPFCVRASMLEVVEKLDDQFVWQLKRCDPHSQQYATVLAYEHRLCVSIRHTLVYLHERDQCARTTIVDTQNAVTLMAQLQSDPVIARVLQLEACTARLKLVEHLYFKLDSTSLAPLELSEDELEQTKQADDVTGVVNTTTNGVCDDGVGGDGKTNVNLDEIRTLCAYIYKVTADLLDQTDKSSSSTPAATIPARDYRLFEQLRAKAMLFQIYNLAVHDHWHRARDLMLMSQFHAALTSSATAQCYDVSAHLTRDIMIRVHYNRTLVQLGLCAFRHGHFRDAHNMLVDLQGSPRVRESLAQGCSQRRLGSNLLDDSVAAEQEELMRRRELPYHMHVSLELLESVYLISAMIIEVSYMASHETDPRRRLISKSFHYQLRNASLRCDLHAPPPDLMREHVVAATRALRRAQWDQCSALLLDTDAMKRRVWSRLYAGQCERRLEHVRYMVRMRIKRESLTVYLHTYGHAYDSVALEKLASMFALSVSQVHCAISQLILSGQLEASFNEPSATLNIYNRRTKASNFVSYAQNLAIKLTGLVESNERLFEAKYGSDQLFWRGATSMGVGGGGGQIGGGMGGMAGVSAGMTGAGTAMGQLARTSSAYPVGLMGQGASGVGSAGGASAMFQRNAGRPGFMVGDKSRDTMFGGKYRRY